jgi:hypothetical protein
VRFGFADLDGARASLAPPRGCFTCVFVLLVILLRFTNVKKSPD